ncbi:MAG: hypothetical protein AAF529_05925 [Pseudomonadota bacterium]
MSQNMRDRAKQLFPSVALTLLSIVQAIALETLWGQIQDAHYLYETSIYALIGWLQVSATLFGLGLIWVIYASNVMRFAWVPTMNDLIYPFLVGLVEFWMVASIGPDTAPSWHVAMAIIVGLVTFITQVSMRAARFDPANKEFFVDRTPAQWHDFLPQIGVVLGLLAIALALWLLPMVASLQLAGALAVLIFLVWQFVSSARFWKRSMQNDQKIDDQA